jgi:YD repeat-containing protein
LGYDNANRRTSLGYSNGTTASYANDLASRLTNITHNGPSGIIDVLTYTYDAAGNRFSASRANGAASLLPNAIASANYDAANEQTAFAGATLIYDANGNLTNDGTNIYKWDARNRLAGISGGATANFQYDAFGRRVSKSINNVGGQYIYDGINILSEIGGGAVSATYIQNIGSSSWRVGENSMRNVGLSTETGLF